MSSIILRTGVRFVTPLMLLLAALLVLRGHNEPGGGFIGGLLAAAGLILQTLASGSGASRRLIRVAPLTLVSGGLLLAAFSGFLAMIGCGAFMTAIWVKSLGLGTPLLFDLGVFMVVVGTTLTVIEGMAEGNA